MSLATELAVWAEGFMPDVGGAAIAAELRRLDAVNKEMLEALEQVLLWGTNENYVKASAAVNQARAAVNKARGQS